MRAVVRRIARVAGFFVVVVLAGLQAARHAPAQTTSTTTTPAVSSTTTTLPDAGHCAQPRSEGPLPTASDCLFILRSALGSSSCTPACMCAPKGTLPITATDALVCLKRAIGQGVTLRCPCEGETTTTVEPTTTTLDITTTTSTTTTSSTTTTTLGGSVQAGQAHYDAVCSACHRAGSHDTNGFAPNLAGKGDLLVNNLGSIDPMMSGITLTNKQIQNLKAFLDSL